MEENKKLYEESQEIPNSTPLRTLFPAKKPVITIIILIIVVSLSGFLVASRSEKLKFVPALPLVKQPTQTPTLTPTPILGNLEGTVVDSFTNQAVPNAKLVVKAKLEFQIMTNKEGHFTMRDIPVDEYVITSNDAGYTIEPTTATIEAKLTNKTSLVAKMNNPLPSKLSGIIYEDKNSNKKKDEDEKGVSALVVLYKFVGPNKTVVQTNITSDKDGNYSYDVPAQAKFFISPGHLTFYQSPSESFYLTADGSGNPIYMNVGYIPEVATSGKLTIHVYNDKNENNQRDSDEENIHYQGVRITNQKTGQSWRVAVPPEGDTESNLEFGNYYIVLDPENESWSYYYKVTKNAEDINVQSASDSFDIYLGAHKLQ